MKMSILNSITRKSSINFGKKVSKLIPDNVKEVYLSTVGMQWRGRGSYVYFLDISFDNGSIHTLSVNTNDSTAYDYYTDLEDCSVKFDNWCKNTCLMILEEKKQEIIELLESEELI